MKKIYLLLLAALFFSLFSAFYLESSKAQSAQEEPAQLFSLAARQQSFDQGGMKPSASIAEVREREIGINLESINFEVTQKLSFPLLDGRTYTAVRRDAEGFERLGDDEFSWRGKIGGEDGWSGDVILTVKGNALSGLIYSPSGVYEIIPQANFKHILAQIDQSLFPPCGGAIPVPKDETGQIRAASKNEGVSLPKDVTAAGDDGSVIDVLIAYTAQVRTALGGTTQAQAFAQQAVTSTNTAYQNSGITTRLRLAGTMEVSYDEAAGTLNAALDWVRADAGVAAARNNTAADLVSIIVENGGGSCGLGYVQQTVGAGFSGWAFSAVARSCAVGNLSFAHELGHNEGCEHNPENGSPAAQASYPYAFGHYVIGAFRTVMSYADPCGAQGCNRIPYFSNPSVNFNGLPTGIANERDNHLVINNTALVVSQFRDSAGRTSPTPTPTPQGQPNLTPYQPTGWSDKIVVSNVTGTSVDAPSFISTDLIYVDWAVINNGAAATGASFQVKLYVDGLERQSLSSSALATNTYLFIRDYPVGTLGAGQHTIKIVADPSGAIAESNEADNEYSKVISVSAAPTPTPTPTASPTPTPTPPASPTISLASSAVYNVAENDPTGVAVISVTRSGDASQAASVKYSTSDGSGLTPCGFNTFSASERCDYITTVGTLRWNAGESGTKTFTIPIINDVLVEGTERFSVTLSNPTGAALGTGTAAVVITDDDFGVVLTNPIDDNSFFIREQYLDFLSRQPDGAGFQNWSNTLNPCPGAGYGLQNPDCDRVKIALSTFQSEEFQTRGYWAYRFYEVAFGRRPNYSEFIPDMALIGGQKSPAETDAAKQQFIDAFVQRAEFRNLYDSKTDAAAFVDALLQTAGLPNLSIKATLISQLQANQISRAQALRQIVETKDVEDRFYNRGLVSMMYFGFMRRDPDQTGFNNYINNIGVAGDWTGKVRQMVFDFIYSTEYRGRFGKP